MNNIFDTDVDLSVGFDKYVQDLLDRGRSRLLYQFKDSPVLDQIVQVISEESQSLYDAIKNVLKERTLNEAKGVQLDIIGKIVGQERLNVSGALKRWFTTDNATLGTDDTPVWMDGVGLYDDTVANDEEYRKLIFAKIFKNHVQGASVPELRRFIKILTNVNVSFKSAGLLDVYLVVPSDIKPNVLSLLTTIIEDDKRVENKYLIPFAATTRLVGLVFIPVDRYSNNISFAPDTSRGTDYGKLAIRTSI